MGKCRIPGPSGCATLSMRSPGPGGAKNSLRDVNVTFLEGSAHPLAFRVVRTNPLRVTAGTNDVNVTRGKDKPPDSKPLGLPDEWAVAAGLADENVPLSFTPARSLPSGAKTYKIRRPLLSFDAGKGVIRGTAVLSIPDGNYPERLVSPLEVPVEVTIELPRSADELNNLKAHVRACVFACVDATVELRYNREQVARLVREAAKAVKDVKQAGTNADQLADAVLDVADVVREAISLAAPGVVGLHASAQGPATWIDATSDLTGNVTGYRWLGFNLIPKGPLFDFDVPGWGYRGSHLLGRRAPHTAALLAYPSLPAIFGGEHWTSKFPAYVYGEVSHAKKVSPGLELGVRLTVALDIWERLGLKPGLTPPSLFEPAPPGGVTARYLSERGTALQTIKDNISPSKDLNPWIMFRVEGRF